MEISAGTSRGLANNAYQNDTRRVSETVCEDFAERVYKDCRNDCQSKEMDERRLQEGSTDEDGGINLVALWTKET